LVPAFLVELAGDSKRALRWALFAEFVLASGFVVTGLIAAPFAQPNAPLALTASVLGVMAMGVQSALVRLLMRGVASTNVMTTNTTLASIELAQWLIAARRAAKKPGDAGAIEALRQARARFLRIMAAAGWISRRRCVWRHRFSMDGILVSAVGGRDIGRTAIVGDAR
jgi:uncharacterized membrane protein YoaK (UPF0700 family)